MLLLGVRGELTRVHSAFADPRVRWRLCASAALVSVNWLTYVWAIGNHRVVESSLGYFINPLLNVVLGVVVLSEGLGRVQWTAVAIAAAGVLWLTWSAGHPPWIAVALALTFGLYGLVRKTVPVDALPGFANCNSVVSALINFCASVKPHSVIEINMLVAPILSPAAIAWTIFSRSSSVGSRLI